MRRREAVQFLGAALALQFLPKSAEAAIELGEQIHRRLGDVPFRTLNPAQQKLVTQIAEMIIPETDTVGATSVKVPQFIDLILTEWMSDDEKKTFLAGLDDLDVQAVGLARLAQPVTGRLVRDIASFQWQCCGSAELRNPISH